MQQKLVLAAAVTALVILLILAARKDKYIPEPCKQNPRLCLRHWDDNDDEGNTPEYTRRQ
jgi:hypothetical protein